MVTDRSTPPIVKCRDRMGSGCFINFNLRGKDCRWQSILELLSKVVYTRRIYPNCRIACQAANILGACESKMLLGNPASLLSLRQ